MNERSSELVVRATMDTQFIQDGIGEDGREVEPGQIQLDQYDVAIRKGDIPYLNWMTSTFGHYTVPILQTNPYYMLDNANHGALLWLAEQDYIVLPDIVSAIIYDDPALLYVRSIDIPLARQIILQNAWNIYLEYTIDIIDLIENTCIYDMVGCDILMKSIRDTKNDVTDDLRKIPSIQQLLTHHK